MFRSSARRGLQPACVLLLLVATVVPAGAEDPPPEPKPTAFADDLLPFGTRRLAHGLREGARDERRHAAVEAALGWLATHQEADGRFRAAEPIHDTGVTGLVLSAFLQAGYTHRGTHRFAPNLRRGLRWLVAQQQPSGRIGAADHARFLYDHAFATHAVVSAYGMTGSPTLHRVAQIALAFARDCRNPTDAWSYGVRDGRNDTSVTGALLLPFLSAQFITLASTQVGRHQPFGAWGPVFGGAQAWFRKATDPDTGRIGYRVAGTSSRRYGESVRTFPETYSECSTAIFLLFRFPPQRTFDKGRVGPQLTLLYDNPPRWLPKSGSVDLLYWWYGAMAMTRVDGGRADDWIRQAENAVLEGQRGGSEAGDRRGSWDPVGVWGAKGGRTYATALGALILTARAAFPWGHSQHVPLNRIAAGRALDPARRLRALRAGATQPTAQSVNGALVALEDEDVDVRRAAVVALGRMGRVARSSRITTALLAIAGGDPDVTTRRAAIWALGRVGEGRRAVARLVRKLEPPEDPASRFLLAASLARIRGKAHPGLHGSLRHAWDPALLVEAARERGLIEGLPGPTPEERAARRLMRHLRLPAQASVPHSGAIVHPLTGLGAHATELVRVLDAAESETHTYAATRDAVGGALRASASGRGDEATVLRASVARLVLARHARALMDADEATREREGATREALLEQGLALASRARTELDQLRAGWDGPHATSTQVTAALLWLEADYLGSWFQLTAQGEDGGLRKSFEALDAALWRWEGTRTARRLALRKAALLHDFARTTDDDEARASLYEGVLILYADAAIGDPRDLPDRSLTVRAFTRRAEICLEARRIGRVNFLRRGREHERDLAQRVPDLGADPGDASAILSAARLLNQGGDQNRALALLDRSAARARASGETALLAEVVALRARIFGGG